MRRIVIWEQGKLERALTLEKRLGGHLVSGHIDGVGQIISTVKEDNAMDYIEANNEILRYIVEKGSVAIEEEVKL